MKTQKSLHDFECELDELLDNAIDSLSQSDCESFLEYICKRVADCEE